MVMDAPRAHLAGGALMSLSANVILGPLTDLPILAAGQMVTRGRLPAGRG